MKSVPAVWIALVLSGFLGFAGLRPASVAAQDSTYRPTPGYDKVVASMNRLRQDGDKLSKETRAVLLAKGQKCLDLEQRDKDGKYPYAQQIKAYDRQGVAIPADVQRLIDAENAREMALYAGFVNDVAGAFANAKAQPQPTKNLTSANRATPLDAPLTSTIGDRSADRLHRIINQFDVENNPRYIGDVTYCNIFVWDVTRALGAEIPHYLNGKEINANAVNTWLHKSGQDYGWTRVDARQAQESANEGRPAVVSWKNPEKDSAGNEKHGHIAVLRPGNIDKEKGPAVAQAGGNNFNSKHVKDGFGERKVEYWIHK